jgi:sec-independent protein translocase protein TatA
MTEGSRRITKEYKMLEGLFQPTHLLILFGVVLLVFGGKKIPELGRGIGEGIRGFKSAMRNEEKLPTTTTDIEES